jgi:hypothetical protein
MHADHKQLRLHFLSPSPNAFTRNLADLTLQCKVYSSFVAVTADRGTLGLLSDGPGHS